MSIDLTGRVALVTGSTRGIGRSIAEVYSRYGARVAISGRNADQAATVATEIGGGCAGFGCDLSSPDEVARLVAEVEAGMGQVDILVNNAGLTRDNLVVRIRDDDWDAVLDTNLRAAFLAIRGVSRGMMKKRWGRIINVSSVVGLIGNKGQANYASSKAGLIGLTKSVAKEYASRNILVNAIAPGFIDTEMTAALTEDARGVLSSQIPLERLGSPLDVANAAAFLASDMASYITGQVLVVDGGMVM